MFDILFLFAVARGFFEGSYDEGGSGGFDRYGGLTVLDGEFYGHALLGYIRREYSSAWWGGGWVTSPFWKI